MKIDMTQPAPCQYAVHIRLGSEGIQPVREAVLKEFQREANIAGFRKGKAPKELVERQYPSQIHEETIRRLTRQTLEQVVTERRLKPVGPFEVKRVTCEAAKAFELEALLDVEPEFKLADYRHLPVKTSPVVVMDEDRAKALAQLQESMAQLVPVPPTGPAPSEAKVKEVPALDDELAKDVGFENLQQLTQHVEAKLREQRSAEQRQATEQALCDALLARHRREVPLSLVAKQAKRLERDVQVRLLLSGLPEEQVKDEVKGS
jgi:FKBP-type peptidyl-prolyl cis-trans isomerase (trigger factor)